MATISPDGKLYDKLIESPNDTVKKATSMPRSCGEFEQQLTSRLLCVLTSIAEAIYRAWRFVKRWCLWLRSLLTVSYIEIVGFACPLVCHDVSLFISVCFSLIEQTELGSSRGVLSWMLEVYVFIINFNGVINPIKYYNNILFLIEKTVPSFTSACNVISSVYIVSIDIHTYIKRFRQMGWTSQLI